MDQSDQFRLAVSGFESYNAAVDSFAAALKIVFPHDFSELLPLCVSESGFPLGFYHPDVLIEALSFRIDGAVAATIRTGYVLLSAHYFLLDAVVDGHLRDSLDSLYLPHLLGGAYALFAEAVAKTNPPLLMDLRKTFTLHVSQNAHSVRGELAFRAQLLNPAEVEEFENIVGRSNSLLLLYHLMAMLSSSPVDRVFEEYMRELVFCIQLGDDLGDWREDIRARRYTSILRLCFSRRGRVLSEEETERELFLTGLFEQRAATVVKRLGAILPKLAETHPMATRFARFVQWQRDRIRGVLLEWVERKLSIRRRSEVLNVAS